MEILQVIRTSGNCVSDVLGTFMVPNRDEKENRDIMVKKAESLFKKSLPNLNEDELEEALENGYGEEPDGDVINLVWSWVTKD